MIDAQGPSEPVEGLEAEHRVLRERLAGEEASGLSSGVTEPVSRRRLLRAAGAGLVERSGVVGRAAPGALQVREARHRRIMISRCTFRDRGASRMISETYVVCGDTPLMAEHGSAPRVG